ncbi:hypothetical protein SAMN05421678_10278 [Actinopolymorpha cephalotaxi]|uniref:Uncharacterized protein n=1 Tax=Actinopolymorpha cephalotaxi TaxID=504797 RepID=A0A1I2LCG5_9ACTN|nr:hypothetical protein [Actinopolymorpha cephalotaxi]NYH84951.1 hypothetical protein [Actinopolymorpha cephalotaxi]SFF77082.1 hypothetical protein SAMN05421678_10278 [Actinopolymorpha cephalotaxi]
MVSDLDAERRGVGEHAGRDGFFLVEDLVGEDDCARFGARLNE